MDKKGFVILLPVYNDWTSVNILIKKLTTVFQEKYSTFTPTVLVVNDCSTITEPLEEHSIKINFIHLNRNVGHQKAIGIGLAYIKEKIGCEFVVVMDSDGEDKPEQIPLLIEAFEGSEGSAIIFAKRGKRNESKTFRIFYKVYKFLFKLLTGKEISFGNFSLVPFKLLEKIVYVSDVWNHFSGGIIKSKLPYNYIVLDRGTRYAGKSQMNFNSLILHGLSALSVHLDVISIRVILFSLSLFIVTIVGVLALLFIRILTDLAVPGWTSTILLGLILFLAQTLTFSFLLIFMYLNYRSQKDFNPLLHYKEFLRNGN